MNSCFSLGHSPKKKKEKKKLKKKKHYNIKGITQILGSASCVLWMSDWTYILKKTNKKQNRMEAEARSTKELEDNK